MNDKFSLNVARVTKKGMELLEDHKQYEESYPERENLKVWVQIEKKAVFQWSGKRMAFLREETATGANS